MRVKRYIVDSMPEALEKIKVDLGKDAIILNTKPIKIGGFLGFFGKQQIEVIAAVDEKNAEKEKPVAKQQHERQVRSATSGYAAKQAYQKAVAGNDQSSTPISRNVITGTTSVGEQGILLDPPVSKPANPFVATSVKETKETLQVETQKQEAEFEITPAAAPRVTAVDQAGQHAIAGELRDMREMFQKLLLLKENSNNLPGPFITIRDRLLSQNVEEDVVATIMKKLLLEVDDPTAVSEMDAHQLTCQTIQKMIEETSPESARIDRSVKFAFFFGPTGVGKTTTIAKLAAESMLKEKRKVGFITSDTYRIAAVEQLKTYGNILNVPLEVVFSPKEIEQAMERLRDCDLIFVDTAGRNYRNDEYVKGIKELLQYGETSANFLVLSLTTKYADMKAILDNFRDLPDGRALFTKADETNAYGAILNVTQHFDVSLSYLTTGQNVPDDITLATPELVTKMIVGDDTYA